MTDLPPYLVTAPLGNVSSTWQYIRAIAQAPSGNCVQRWLCYLMLATGCRELKQKGLNPFVASHRVWIHTVDSFKRPRWCLWILSLKSVGTTGFPCQSLPGTLLTARCEERCDQQTSSASVLSNLELVTQLWSFGAITENGISGYSALSSEWMWSSVF